MANKKRNLIIDTYLCEILDKLGNKLEIKETASMKREYQFVQKLRTQLRRQK